MRPYVQGTDASALLGVRLETDKTAGRMYAAYPNLANVRWLLPTKQPALRRAGIEGLYQPSSLRGRALRTIIGAGALQGQKVWLEEDNLQRLETMLASVMGVEAVRLAFYLGVPAPHRKVTAQVLTPEGKTLAYAKIATSQLAQAALKTERRALSRLSQSAGLQGTVPEVLGSLEWHGGTILLITMGPPRPGPRGLSSAHLRFCTQLFQSFRGHQTFVESPMWSSMSEIWLHLQRSSPETLPANLGPALERLHDELGPVNMPLSLAHGDFAPWNTRLGERSLFVLDWERASEGMTPLYDAFNFQALQSALLGRRKGIRDRLFLLRLLDAIWPEGHKHLPILYLAYLTHVTLLYSEAQSLVPGVGDKKVWHWFAQQIESALHEDASSMP
ncbi:MAG TPA: phosphotransferase [Rubrobacter sp.]|nr:phosphotransferase [Rubrobacter sp.]